MLASESFQSTNESDGRVNRLEVFHCQALTGYMSKLVL